MKKIALWFPCCRSNSIPPQHQLSLFQPLFTWALSFLTLKRTNSSSPDGTDLCLPCSPPFFPRFLPVPFPILRPQSQSKVFFPFLKVFFIPRTSLILPFPPLKDPLSPFFLHLSEESERVAVKFPPVNHPFSYLGFATDPPLCNSPLPFSTPPYHVLSGD